MRPYRRLSAVDTIVGSVGLDRNWLDRAEAQAEKVKIESSLDRISAEISVWDRMLFFQDSPAEGEEKRLKLRKRELDNRIRQLDAALEEGWARLGREFPAVDKALRLEAVLTRCLCARSEAQRVSALQACRELLEAALKSRSAHPPPEMSLPAVWQALGQVERYLPSICALEALLEMSRPLMESTWAGPRNTLLYRPLVFRLVRRAMADFKDAEPETPLPSELACRWLEDSPQSPVLPGIPDWLLPVYPAAASHEPLQLLEGLVLELARLDLGLDLVGREISRLSRLAFWTDTPSEENEKIYKSARAETLRRFKSAWRDYVVKAAQRRCLHRPAFVADQALLIRDAISKISTQSGESTRPRHCSVCNLAKAVAAVQAFADQPSESPGVPAERLLAVELAASLQRVGAESVKRQKSLSLLGKSLTREYHGCVLTGMRAVEEVLQRLLAIARPPEGGLSPLAALEARALVDCDEQGLLATMLGPEGVR